MVSLMLWIATLAATFAQGTGSIAQRDITIVARQYGYEPNRIVVDAGDTIRLRFVSRDTVHGLFIEGHDLDARVLPGVTWFEVRKPSGPAGYTSVEEVVFRTERPGKFRYRCSVTCGPLHPFMQGELIVRPNAPYLAGLAGVALIVIGLLGWTVVPAGVPAGSGRRIDLLAAFPRLRGLVTRRWFQPAIVIPNLLLLVFFIAAGLLGTPVGNRNIAVTIVWILWWFLLIVVLVPIGGRVWCLMCPMPSLGEWLARRRLIGVVRLKARRRRWPRRLDNLWLQNVLFLAVCSVSTILVTRPGATALVLAALVVAATATHLVFDRRTFCRYVCPLNGWMSLYAMTSLTEVRPRDPAVCGSCRTRACVAGTGTAWPCPWLAIPFRLDRNNYCGLCMECVKACPDRNLTVRLRPFCADRKIGGLDEAWMACIMVALAIGYSVTLLGPWSTVRQWANVTEHGDWIGFAIHTAAVWFAALVLIPGVWYAASWASARWLIGADVTPRQVFTRYAFMLVPLGLMAWIAFSVPLLMVNYTHITASLSDPLGTGLDLFGTSMQQWEPLLPSSIPYIQVPVLLAGLLFAVKSGGAVAAELRDGGSVGMRSMLPHAFLCVVFTLVLLRLHVG